MTTRRAPSAQTASSLADQAYTSLRNHILTCDIAPGTLVTEAQLSAEMKLGKTPVREALARLAGEGLVRPVVRRGYEVAPITIAGVLDIFEAYSVFAPEVIALIAVRATPAEKQFLADSVRRWASGSEEVHPEELPHNTYVKYCRNQVITDMTKGVMGHVTRVFNFALIHGGFANPEYLEAREEAIRAIRDSDPEAARAAMAKTIEGERLTIVGLLQNWPSLMRTPLTLQRTD